MSIWERSFPHAIPFDYTFHCCLNFHNNLSTERATQSVFLDIFFFIQLMNVIQGEGPLKTNVTKRQSLDFYTFNSWSQSKKQSLRINNRSRKFNEEGHANRTVSYSYFISNVHNNKNSFQFTNWIKSFLSFNPTKIHRAISSINRILASTL